MSRHSYGTRLVCATFVSAVTSTCGAQVAWDQLPVTRHSDLQAVTAQGAPAYTGGFPLRVRGVLLCEPGSVFSDAPNFIPVRWPSTAFAFGGRQQPYVQSVDPTDVGGTALFLAQCLGNHPVNQDDSFSYTNAEWLAEVDRLSRDPLTGHVFQAGDLVEVRARVGLHFSGKFNINEAHSNNPNNNYDVILIQAGFGLPEPAQIALGTIKSAINADIFDPTRATGGERYQSQRVKLRNVTLTSGTGWQAQGVVTVGDGTRTLPVVLGTDPAFNSTPAPTGMLDIVGIIDQEASPSPIGGTNGYRLIVIRPSDFTLACAANFDGSPAVDVQDIFGYLNAWFAGDPRADVDGVIGVDVQDIFTFLNLWFTGCP